MLMKRLVSISRRLALVNKAKPWSVCARAASTHGPYSDYVHANMDELPVPCGDWYEDYCNKQRKYNIHLIFGSGFFLITVLVAMYSGLLNTYSTPPKKPGPRPEAVC